MVQDTIQAVKEAEAKAAQTVKEASEKGKSLVDAAKRQAEQMKEEAQAAVKRKAAESADGLAKDGEAYLEKSMKESQEEIAAMKAAAELKTDRAVELIISELL